MTRYARTLLVTLATCVVAVAAVTAAQNLSGNWTMKVEGGPHGAAEMTIALRQEADKVHATFNPGHDGDIALTGTFIKNQLELSTEPDDAGSRLTMKATLKPDGTLSGYLSSAMGDMTWTAARAK